MTPSDQKTAAELTRSWREDARWRAVERPYSAEDVVRLRGTVRIEHTLARRGAERLWDLLHREPFVRCLGALTGAQAVQMVQSGLKSIYVSGWQVAGDMNDALQTYPDQSLYPALSVPNLVRRINNALARADQIAHAEGRSERMPDWFVPIVADAEAGFGGALNAFELAKALIEAGAAGMHLEDQLSSAKKCGHMGGKVLVPTHEAIQKLVAARLAADILDVPAVIVARTDAETGALLTSDIDEADRPFLTGERTYEGFYRTRAGLDQAIARALSYAPYGDVLWCETARPDLGEARRFADAVLGAHPDKLLAYNCSPSFNWRANLEPAAIADFQRELAALGYRYQFITLAGFHALNATMFELAHGYRDKGMVAYASLQERELELERDHGYRAVKHQAFVGAGYFDEIAHVISSGRTSTAALRGSTESAQFVQITPDFSESEIHHRGAAENREVPPPPRLVD